MEFAKIGKTKIFRVDEIEGSMMNPTDLFSDATEDRLQKHRQWLTPDFLDQNGILVMSIHGYLVETSRYKILVDPGVGRDKKQKGKDGRFMQNLQKIGVEANQIDYVLFTHMHSDHIGWNTILEGDQWVLRSLMPSISSFAPSGIIGEISILPMNNSLSERT